MGWGCPGYGIGGGGWSLLGMLPALLIFFGLLIVFALSLVWLVRCGCVNQHGNRKGFCSRIIIPEGSTHSQLLPKHSDKIIGSLFVLLI